jgi:large subunit ribosomal protein L27
VKRTDGQAVKNGEIIVRQRGTKIEAGKGVKVGKDHTIFAVTDGVVAFRKMRKISFTGQAKTKRAVDVIAAA